jgi:GT2 family glycosyltransferase
MSRLAVVILNYNGLHFLQTFLGKVVACSKPHDVIVADNGSSDGSVSWLRKNLPEVRIIEFPENYGFCTGYNIALKQCQADYYVLLNSDVEVTPGWIEPILKLLEADPEVAAVQPKMLAHHDRERFEYAGATGGFIDMLGYPFCRGRIFSFMEKDVGQYDEETEIFWASGACMFIKSTLFHDYGGLDDDFFAHVEEIDLCWRLKNAGFKIMYTPKSTVYHIGGGTLSKLNPQKTFLNFRNALVLLIKNLPGFELRWKLPVRMAMDYIAAIKFLLSGEVGNALAVLRAHQDLWKHFRLHLRKRSGRIKRTKAISGIYQGLILVDFHFRKVRKFSDLPAFSSTKKGFFFSSNASSNS